MNGLSSPSAARFRLAVCVKSGRRDSDPRLPAWEDHPPNVPKHPESSQSIKSLQPPDAVCKASQRDATNNELRYHSGPKIVPVVPVARRGMPSVRVQAADAYAPGYSPPKRRWCVVPRLGSPGGRPPPALRQESQARCWGRDGGSRWQMAMAQTASVDVIDCTLGWRAWLVHRHRGCGHRHADLNHDRPPCGSWSLLLCRPPPPPNVAEQPVGANAGEDDGKRFRHGRGGVADGTAHAARRRRSLAERRHVSRCALDRRRNRHGCTECNLVRTDRRRGQRQPSSNEQRQKPAAPTPFILDFWMSLKLTSAVSHWGQRNRQE